MVPALWRYYNMWRFWGAAHQIRVRPANGARGATARASETFQPPQGRCQSAAKRLPE
jgi:hypothetical protein